MSRSLSNASATTGFSADRPGRGIVNPHRELAGVGGGGGPRQLHDLARRKGRLADHRRAERHPVARIVDGDLHRHRSRPRVHRRRNLAHVADRLNAGIGHQRQPHPDAGGMGEEHRLEHIEHRIARPVLGDGVGGLGDLSDLSDLDSARGDDARLSAFSTL